MTLSSRLTIYSSMRHETLLALLAVTVAAQVPLRTKTLPCLISPIVNVDANSNLTFQLGRKVPEEIRFTNRIYRLFGESVCEITLAPGDPDFLPKSREIAAQYHIIDVEVPLSAPNGPALISW